MFVTVRRYDAKGPVDVIGRRARDGLVPLLRQQSGFRAYYAFADDDGRPVSVSVFDGRETAVAANERVRVWVAENLEVLLQSPPEVTSGEMRHGVVPPRQQAGGAEETLYVTIRTYDGVASVDGAFLRTRSSLVPLIKRQPGLRSYCSLGSEQDGNRIVSVTVFDDRETAVAANERVREVIAAELRDLFPNPPLIAAGPTFAAATA